MVLEDTLQEISQIIDRLSFQMAFAITLALLHRYNIWVLSMSLVGLSVFVVTLRTMFDYWKLDSMEAYTGFFWILERVMSQIKIFLIYVLVQVVVKIVDFGVDGRFILLAFCVIILIGILVFAMFHVADRCQLLRGEDILMLDQIARAHPQASEKTWMQLGKHAATNPMGKRRVKKH